jgi:3-hydroxybutyryl-CoA dehydrogenase
MTTSGIERVTVLGGGVLGSQIAWHSAFRGKTVTVFDVEAAGIASCQRAHEEFGPIYQDHEAASAQQIVETSDRLLYTTDLGAAVTAADLVIEAVPEVPDIKTAVYEEMAALLPEHTLIATNTSTLLPSDFATATGRPEKYCALHFANHIWSLNFAEVMAHATTAADTLRAVTAFAIEIGMVPVPIQKEQSGYVCNSLLLPLLQASQSLITQGVADHETVDRTYMIMNRGCSMGPCGMMDMIGFGTLHNVLSYWGKELGDPAMIANGDYIKSQFIDQGLMGTRTGRGYYTYPDPAYQAPGFIAVPDMADLDALTAKAMAGARVPQ